MTPSNVSSKITFPSWEREYQAAVQETNPLKLGEKIYAAEASIIKRVREISDGPADSAERQAIDRATAALHELQIKTFGHPDWQT